MSVRVFRVFRGLHSGSAVYLLGLRFDLRRYSDPDPPRSFPISTWRRHGADMERTWSGDGAGVRKGTEK